MTNKKHNKDNPGQRPLAGFPQEMEAVDKTERPKGMPSLAVLRTEMARMGYPETDADHQFDYWLTTGFKTARGQLIQNWKAALRMVIRRGWLPSQIQASRNADTQRLKQEAELARIRRLKHGRDQL